MGPQMGERVFALEVYNGELYAGGFFLNGVSKWTGSQWVAAGGGIPNSAVRDIMVYGNDLIAVGDFLYEPGSPMRDIARFNGTSWQPVGLGIGFEGATTDDPGFTLATFGDELVVGGWFTVADHKPNAYWAHFGCEATTGVPVVPSTTRLSMRGPWPQPARESFNVSFTLPTASRATIELIDLMGRRIERQDVGSFGIGSHQVTFGRTRPLSPGVYMVRLTQGEASASVKAVVLP
jgi:hypothetical protein